MSLILIAVSRWLISKGVVIIVAGAIIVGGFAFYTFVQEGLKAEKARELERSDLAAKSDLLKSELDKYEGRLHAVFEELKDANRDLQRAKKGIEYLQSALAKIEYVFMTQAERERHNRRLNREEGRARDQKELIESLELETMDLNRLKELALLNTADIRERISEIEGTSPSVATYALNSWRKMKSYFFVALLVILFGPLVIKAFAYYIAAPLLAISSPILFEARGDKLPSLGKSGVSASVELKKGDVAWIKESYLQASDEDFSKKTCFVLDWSIPFTCVAAGLTELIEFRLSDDSELASLTVSTQDRSDVEIVEAELSEGSSLIIRPSHISGVVSRTGERMSIRRHWRLFSIQSWITLQFRYFEIVGPCVVFISGVRGVRAELIKAGNVKGRRTNQSATIGFVPGLRYSAVRAETFWSYLRGFNPLFDDVFRGEGIFLCQEISNSLDGAPVRKFWSQIWNSALKLLGI